MIYVIKRNKTNELFDTKKLFASVYSTCLACDLTEKESSRIARAVTRETNSWLHNKSELTSNDIHMHTKKILNNYCKPAGYLYAHHRIIN